MSNNGITAAGAASGPGIVNGKLESLISTLAGYGILAQFPDGQTSG